MLKLTEAAIKRAVIDYLGIGQAQGRWVYLQLNAGDFIVLNDDGSHRMIKGCKKGTSDLVVIRGWLNHCQVTFLELKSEKGRQTEAQKEFARMVEGVGASYFIIRALETLQEVLND